MTCSVANSFTPTSLVGHKLEKKEKIPVVEQQYYLKTHDTLLLRHPRKRGTHCAVLDSVSVTNAHVACHAGFDNINYFF